MKLKKLFPYSLTAMLILVVALSGCGSGGSSSSGGGGTTYTPGQSSAYTVGGVAFNMRYAPSGSFTSDDNTIMGTTVFPATITVANAYWIAETDVTYQLWSAVKTWATTTAANKYTFVTGDGYIGSGNTGSVQQPVTNINWREAMIWCNALTEYYYGNSANCVYYSDAAYTTPIRSVDDVS
jgi:hypothetical protein